MRAGEPSGGVLAGGRLWVAWAVTRVLAVLALVLVDPWVAGDLEYYAEGFATADALGWSGVLVEYPPAAVLLLAPAWLVAGAFGGAEAFPAVVVVQLLLVDAAATGLLARARRGLVPAAAAAWLVGVPLLGATTYARFDLLAGVLAAAAVLLAASRPRVAGAVLAVAAAVKLWPAALLVALVATAWHRAAALGLLGGAVVGGAVLLAASLGAVGLDRTLSPLAWQGDRGLQVESVAATPAVLARAVGLGDHDVAMASSNSFEVDGPLTDVLLALADAAVLGAGVLLLALALRTWLAGPAARRRAAPWLVVAAVLAVVVTSKVLSPQYLLWVLPVVAAAATAAPDPRDRTVGRWTGWLLVATAATHVVFPVLYDDLVGRAGSSLVPTLVLVGRNALLVVLLAVAVQQVLQATRASTPAGDAAAPAPASPPGTAPARRVVVVVPTYDEAANLERIVGRVRRAQPHVHVLVVDDASPDGTGELAEAMAGRDDHVHVLHGEGKGGLGRAYLRGFAWALEQGFDVVGEMDADGSHRPEQLDRLLRAVDDGADLVLGSRWVPGGSVVGWARSRRAISVAGNLYARLALRIPLRDMTGGYRLYRADGLRRLRLDEVESTGYCFQVDLARRAWHAGLRVVEVPIDFVEREAGASKMSTAVALESLRRVTAWGWAERARGELPTVDAVDAALTSSARSS